jgi:hypothetical protein
MQEIRRADMYGNDVFHLQQLIKGAGPFDTQLRRFAVG